MTDNITVETPPPAYQEVFPTAPTELDVTRLPGPATENRTVTRIDIDQPEVRYIRSESCHHPCRRRSSCREAKQSCFSKKSPPTCFARLICAIPFLIFIGCVIYLGETMYNPDGDSTQEDCYWNCDW